MNPIAYIYWRRIKAGGRTYEAIPNAAVKADVKLLAKDDVTTGEITSEQFETLIGETAE